MDDSMSLPPDPSLRSGLPPAKTSTDEPEFIFDPKRDDYTTLTDRNEIKAARKEIQKELKKQKIVGPLFGAANAVWKRKVVIGGSVAFVAGSALAIGSICTGQVELVVPAALLIGGGVGAIALSPLIEKAISKGLDDAGVLDWGYELQQQAVNVDWDQVWEDLADGASDFIRDSLNSVASAVDGIGRKDQDSSYDGYYGGYVDEASDEYL